MPNRYVPSVKKKKICDIIPKEMIKYIKREL